MKENITKKNSSNGWLTFALVVVVGIIATYFGYMFAVNGSPNLQPAPSPVSPSAITLTGTFVAIFDYSDIDNRASMISVDFDEDGVSDGLVSFLDGMMGSQFGYYDSRQDVEHVIIPKGTKLLLENCKFTSDRVYICEKKTIGSGARNIFTDQGNGDIINQGSGEK